MKINAAGHKKEPYEVDCVLLERGTSINLDWIWKPFKKKKKNLLSVPFSNCCIGDFPWKNIKGQKIVNNWALLLWNSKIKILLSWLHGVVFWKARHKLKIPSLYTFFFVHLGDDTWCCHFTDFWVCWPSHLIVQEN